MIEVNDLVKAYGNYVAVKGISFTAQPGQVTGFLGPNGAGKTTTMRMLSGYTPPTSGTATVAGYDIFEQNMQVRQNVGYLPENVPLYRDMTAIGYLMYLAELRGVRNRKSRAMDALERVQLAKRADSLIGTLSKGMRQRVGLAAALLHDPAVLILDEPTIGLDPIQVMQLRNLVSELGRDHTVLFSSHILSEAEQICDNLVIINQGHIIAQGSPQALRDELEQGQRIYIRTEEAPDTIIPTLQAVEGVQRVVSERDGVLVTPRYNEGELRPALNRALVNAGYSVIEIRSSANNLEEIFLELTLNSANDPATATTTDSDDAAEALIEKAFAERQANSQQEEN